MATYKVIQDIEAEDKILGPLTLRQFIYAGITIILLYLSYFVVSKGLAFLIILFFPPAVVFGFFAFPWGRDQPTEVWALAKIRFLFKPRKRIWDQSGVKELVTITAPKIVQDVAASQLSQTEVKSRLRALADTIDTRGWAIKNVTSPAFGMAPPMQQQVNSDRLFDVSSAPAQQAIATDVTASDDMLDERANPRAQQVDSMISAAATAHRQKLMSDLQSPNPPAPPKPAADYWFLNQSAQPAPTSNLPSNTVTFAAPQLVEPGTASNDNSQAASTAVDEEAIVHELDEHKEQGPNSSYYGHLRTIEPISVQKQKAAKQATESAQAKAAMPPLPPPPPPVTPAQQAAILKLASNDDLNVATIAREAKRERPDDEVVIKLH